MPKKRARSKQLQDKPKVEVVNRPLFHKGTKELELLFQEAKAKCDLNQLEALDHELSFREKPQSIELAIRVRKELGRYVEVESPPPPSPKPEPVPPVLTPPRGPQPHLPFPPKTPPPAPDTPLRDVLDWLETVAQNMTDEQARALRESLKARYPGFAEFAAERERGETK